MERFNIILPKALQKEIDAQAKKEKLNRSSFIRKTVYLYLRMKKQQAENQLMKEGCQATYNEMKKVNEEFRYADQETLKYLDEWDDAD